VRRAAIGQTEGVQANGVISGTPTETGSFTFTVQITDAAKLAALGQLQLKIDTHLRDVPVQGPGCEVRERRAPL